MTSTDQTDPPERHARLVADLRRAVLEGPGVTAPATRRSVAAAEPVAPPLDAYLDKVRDASYRVVDRDVSQLRGAGHGEEEIFELTVAAALGKALQPFDQAMRHLRRQV